MFRSRDNVVTINHRPGSLQRLDEGHSHARHKVRILAISFIGSSPTRLARNIEIRTENLVATARSSFKRGGGENPRDEIRIKTAGERQGLRKACASLGHVTVQDFVMKNRGYSQPGVLDQPFLNCVRKQGSLAGAHSFSLSGDLADSVLQHFFGLFGREISPASREV